jgi:macrolide transport system ATP-binding/permease protein
MNWIRRLFSQRRLYEDLSEEIRSHLEERTEELVASGLAKDDAAPQARREFGNVTAMEERGREVWQWPPLASFFADIRFGARMLRKSPGLAAVAVLTLTLGVGATTAIFSVTNEVFGRGLPASSPGRLVGLRFDQKNNSAESTFSYPDFEDIRRQAHSFSAMFAYRIGLDGLDEGNRADQIVTSFVTSDYFTTLGLKPAAGRLILPTEGRVPGSDPIVVLGYSYWREKFGSDPTIVGKQVEVDGRAFTVVGVAPKDFRGLFSVVDIQAFLPINMFSIEDRDRGWANDRTSRSLYVLGRLRTGVSPEGAQASLDVIARRLAQQYPKDWRDAAIETYPGEAANALYQPSRHTYRLEQMAAGLFLALAGLVFLLACFNVTNILIVRARAREREMAVRSALGASSSRLVRQLFTESLLLALLGGFGGVLFAAAASRALGSIHLHAGIPISLDFSFDSRVFLCALSCAIAAAILVGVFPAVRAAHADAGNWLHGGMHGAAPGCHHLRDAFVVAQLAGSMVLLMTAGLFIRSLEKVTQVELGFDPRNLINISLDPHEIGYDEDRGRELYRDLLARVRELPGVRSASLAFSFPTSEYSESERVYVEGHLPPPGQAGPRVFDNSVSSGYFETMGIPILEGRGIEESDDRSAPRVAVVNQTMAQEFWPGEDAVGKRFKLSVDSDRWIEIIGIARDSKALDLTTQTPPYFYLVLDQDYAELVTLQVRTRGSTEGMARRLEEEIHGLAPGLPLFSIQTMNQALDSPKGFFHYKLGSALATVLGILGLALAMIGLYGIVSHSVSERTREIGIRVALGAQPREIAKIVFAQGASVVGVGLLVGLLVTLATTKVMSRLVFGISAYDAQTFAAVASLLAIVAVLACYVPARRAMRVDPVVAIQCE